MRQAPSPAAEAVVTVQPYQPRPKRSPVNGRTPGAASAAATQSRPRLPVHATLFEWRNPRTIPPRGWVYGGHYIRRFVSSTVAPGGVGKSTLAVVEALAIATARPLLGITPAESTRVWLWNGEDPREELERRVIAAMLHFNIGVAEVEGRLFLDSGRTSEIVIAEQTREGAKVAQADADGLERTIRENKIGVVILDPFVSAHRVAENDNGMIAQVAKEFAGIADRTGAAVELVHHVRKLNGAEATVEDGRGASALLNAARSARAINQMTDKEAAEFRVENRRLYFHTLDGKANLAPPAESRAWFKLVGVDLGNATADRPSDWVGVVTAWTPPDVLGKVTAEHMDEVRRRVAVEDFRENEQAKKPPRWVGYLVAEVVGLDVNDPADKRVIKTALSAWFASGALALSEPTKDSKGRDRSGLVRPGAFND